MSMKNSNDTIGNFFLQTTLYLYFCLYMDCGALLVNEYNERVCPSWAGDRQGLYILWGPWCGAAGWGEILPGLAFCFRLKSMGAFTLVPPGTSPWERMFPHLGVISNAISAENPWSRKGRAVGVSVACNGLG